MLATMEEAASAAKHDLRLRMRALRRALGDRPARSEAIWAAVQAIPEVERARRVMVFATIPGEPEMAPFIEWCARHGLDVYHPEVDGHDLRVQPGDLDPQRLDVVLVPGLAFTGDGRRLGQGGGHYDRFLPRLRHDCMTIGVCFSLQLVDDLPTDERDARVHHVVTDRGLA